MWQQIDIQPPIDNQIIDFSIDKNFNLPDVAFEFDLDEGMINPASLYNESIKIDEASLSGQFITSNDEISIENLYLKFDGAEMNSEGTISSISGDPDVMIVADVSNMPLINLKTYWPPELLKGARTWIENNLLVSYWSTQAQRQELSSVSLFEGMIDKYGLGPFSSVKVDQERSSFNSPAPIALQKTKSGRITKGYHRI